MHGRCATRDALFIWTNFLLTQTERINRQEHKERKEIQKNAARMNAFEVLSACETGFNGRAWSHGGNRALAFFAALAVFSLSYFLGVLGGSHLNRIAKSVKDFELSRICVFCHTCHAPGR